MEQPDPRWRKSTHSGNGGVSCVETGHVPGAVLIRDTKNHGNGPVLRISSGDWNRFTTSIKR